MCQADWIRVQTCYHGATSPQRNGRSTHRWFRRSGRYLARQRSTSSPQKTTLIAWLIIWRTWTRWPTTGPTSSFTLFPQSLWSRRSSGESGNTNTVLLVTPLWRNQHWFSELSQLFTAAPWPIPLRRDLLSQANRTMWHPRPELSAHLASRWELTDLPESIQNTISQARAPSTRRLYTLKWSVFSAWCSTRGTDLFSCDILLILSFLQELLDKGHSPSTLKVYVAAIAASHAPIAGQSVGRNNIVVRFLKGSRRLNTPRPLTVPTWDLPTVLRALKSPPFEPLQSVYLRPLSLKTALLLALAWVKQMGDLQALYGPPYASS